MRCHGHAGALAQVRKSMIWVPHKYQASQVAHELERRSPLKNTKAVHNMLHGTEYSVTEHCFSEQSL